MSSVGSASGLGGRTGGVVDETDLSVAVRHHRSAQRAMALLFRSISQLQTTHTSATLSLRQRFALAKNAAAYGSARALADEEFSVALRRASPASLRAYALYLSEVYMIPGLATAYFSLADDIDGTGERPNIPPVIGWRVLQLVTSSDVANTADLASSRLGSRKGSVRNLASLASAAPPPSMGDVAGASSGAAGAGAGLASELDDLDDTLLGLDLVKSTHRHIFRIRVVNLVVLVLFLVFLVWVTRVNSSSMSASLAAMYEVRTVLNLSEMIFSVFSGFGALSQLGNPVPMYQSALGIRRAILGVIHLEDPSETALSLARGIREIPQHVWGFENPGAYITDLQIPTWTADIGTDSDTLFDFLTTSVDGYATSFSFPYSAVVSTNTVYEFLRRTVANTAMMYNCSKIAATYSAAEAVPPLLLLSSPPDALKADLEQVTALCLDLVGTGRAIFAFAGPTIPGNPVAEAVHQFAEERFVALEPVQQPTGAILGGIAVFSAFVIFPVALAVLRAVQFDVFATLSRLVDSDRRAIAKLAGIQLRQRRRHARRRKSGTAGSVAGGRRGSLAPSSGRTALSSVPSTEALSVISGSGTTNFQDASAMSEVASEYGDGTLTGRSEALHGRNMGPHPGYSGTTAGSRGAGDPGWSPAGVAERLRAVYYRLAAMVASLSLSPHTLFLSLCLPIEVFLLALYFVLLSDQKLDLYEEFALQGAAGPLAAARLAKMNAAAWALSLHVEGSDLVPGFVNAAMPTLNYVYDISASPSVNPWPTAEELVDIMVDSAHDASEALQTLRDIAYSDVSRVIAPELLLSVESSGCHRDALGLADLCPPRFQHDAYDPLRALSSNLRFLGDEYAATFHRVAIDGDPNGEAGDMVAALAAGNLGIGALAAPTAAYSVYSILPDFTCIPRDAAMQFCTLDAYGAVHAVDQAFLDTVIGVENSVLSSIVWAFATVLGIIALMVFLVRPLILKITREASATAAILEQVGLIHAAIERGIDV
jgi:hypothetical protein